MNEMNEKIESLVKNLPPEVAALIQALRLKVDLLEDSNQLLKRENEAFKKNQDVVMRSHRDLYEENLQLKRQLERDN